MRRPLTVWEIVVLGSAEPLIRKAFKRHRLGDSLLDTFLWQYSLDTIMYCVSNKRGALTDIIEQAFVGSAEYINKIIEEEES